MRILKSHPIFRMVNSYLIDSPQPSNLSYLWNFGSLLAFCLIIQIITGVTLAMHYNPSVLEAFNSVEHIMRDVNNGWLIRYLHSNTASAFFFLVYLHIGRGLYYGSYRSPRTLTWVIGTIILIVMMATAFLGYEHSPKWYNLNLLFSNISLLLDYIYSYYLIIIILFLIKVSIVLLHLIDFKLLFRSLLILITFLFVYFLLIYDTIILPNIILYINDINTSIGTNVRLEGNVHINDIETSKSWAATGAKVVVSGLVGKAVPKAPMPPLQKAGVLIIGTVAGGLFSMATNYFNIALSGTSNTTSGSLSDSSISKLISN
jgi:hypothetical protein